MTSSLCISELMIFKILIIIFKSLVIGKGQPFNNNFPPFFDDLSKKLLIHTSHLIIKHLFYYEVLESVIVLTVKRRSFLDLFWVTTIYCYFTITVFLSSWGMTYKFCSCNIKICIFTGVNKLLSRLPIEDAKKWVLKTKMHVRSRHN